MRETAEAERLEDLLETKTSSVRSPPGLGVRDTRIVSPMPSAREDRQAGRAGDDAFGAESGFGEAQVERVIAAGGEAAMGIDQVGDENETLAEMTMRSCPSPASSARAAERRALSSIASM